MTTGKYDPFVPGRFQVGVRSFQAFDPARGRTFPCEIWHPEGQGVHPLIIYSHPSTGNRRAATFLCDHLGSHGYVVAAMDHSESVAPELGRQTGETAEQRAARVEAIISSRVPDVRFLLDHLLHGDAPGPEIQIDAGQIGIVGHSFGGWTALAAVDVEPRIGSVVALAPGGASNPRPGILPLTLDFRWNRDVPTLFLVAEDDVSLPLGGMVEIFERTPASKRMVILRRADHLHFMDNIEELHEKIRNMEWPAELAWIQKEMRPIAELCSGGKAQLFVRGLTLCHLDATLGRLADAQRFLSGDIEAELAARGIEAMVRQPDAARTPQAQ